MKQVNPQDEIYPVAVVGASAAGLACAARLQKAGSRHIILEKERQVATRWRQHYDRLHLHTPKRHSHLPFKKFDKDLPTYISRDDLVAYLEDYEKYFGLKPIYNTEISAAYKTDDHWVLESKSAAYKARKVIICTGKTNKPRMITKPGIETFPGTIIHSSSYKNGRAYDGKKVLVVGFGNSAGEIAICLAEHNAEPVLSVRAEVNVIPRDVLGIPVLQLSRLQAALPPRIGDMISFPLRKITIGDVSKYGLRQAPYGPMQQVALDQRTPLINHGTLELIAAKKLKVYGDIKHISGRLITFDNGAEEIDDIILATGYRDDLESFLPIDMVRREDLVKPYKKRRFRGKDSLYFCGFYLSPLGMLGEINKESRHIIKDIKSNL